MATARMNGFLRRLTRGMAAEALAGQDDRRLVERLLAGPDEAAFEALVRRHGPMVYRVCWRVMPHAEDCEDAFQATFLLLTRKLSTVRRQDSLASWLHGVAHRVALDARARVARRRRHEWQIAPAAPVPPDEITWKELRTVLDAELAGLPERLRSPLILCYLQGLTQDEAAGRLGCSKSTLLRRLEQGRAALGRRLTRKGFVWPAALSAVLLSDCVAPAALSQRILDSTTDAAAQALAGRAAAAVVSPLVLSLTEGMEKAMSKSKWKSVLPALLLGGALLAGAFSPLAEGFAVNPEPLVVHDGDKARAGRKPVVVRQEAQMLHASWSADGKLVATTCVIHELVENNDDDVPRKYLLCHCTVKLWDAGTGRLIRSLGEEKRTYLNAQVMSPDNKHLAVAGFRQDPPQPGRVLTLFDAHTRAVVQDLGDEHYATALAFSPDGKTLAMGGQSPLTETGSWIKCWDVQGKKTIAATRFAEQEPEERGGWQVQWLAFSPDGKALAAAEWSRSSERAKIQIYDVRTGKPKREWDLGESRGVCQVVFTGDGKRLVSASGALKIWDVQTGKELKTLENKGALSNEIALSPDGRRLASTGFRKENDKLIGEIFLWDAKTGELQQTLPWQEPAMWISSIAFSPDGRSLAVSATTDADIRVKDGHKTQGKLVILPLAP
jgi:RNA polymerase sigma factor (sigma-70 family)